MISPGWREPLPGPEDAKTNSGLARSSLQPIGKVRPPQHGRVLQRERLFRTLDALSESPGLWIHGLPGLGKTTLVATFLEASNTACLWLRLDASADDPVAFLQLLNLAISDSTTARKATLSVPHDDDLNDVAGLFRRSFQQLANTFPYPWVLVLDDVQAVNAGSQLHAGLAAALETLPGCMRIIFISRDPVPTNLSLVIAKQLIIAVDAETLRFSTQETRALIALHGVTCPAADLHRLTDGWPAAMILILAAGGLSHSGTLANEGQAREHLFAYFAAEVVGRMTPDDAATLEQLAWLPSMTESMATAISGNAQAGTLLSSLAARSLFTYKRDQAEPVYSFHGLFASHLRTRLAARVPFKTLRQQRRFAIRLLIQHGQLDAAITEMIRGCEWALLVGIVNEHAASHAKQGRIRTIESWVAALPTRFQELPSVKYWSGVCHLATNPAKALRSFQQASVSYAAEGDLSGCFLAAAGSAEAIVSLGDKLDLLEPLLEILETQTPAYLMGHKGKADLLVIPGLLAAFVYCRTGHALIPQLVAISEQLLNEPRGASQRIMLSTTALYLLWTGQLVRLDRIMLKLDLLCDSQTVPSATRMRWYGIGVMVRSLLGHTELALRDARAALALVKQHSALHTKAHLLMTLACLAAQNAPLAREHLDKAALTIGLANTIDLTTYDFQSGLLLQLEGNIEAATRVMRESLDAGRRCGWPLREHIALLGCALTATETGDLDTAVSMVDEAISHPFHAVCKWHQWLCALVEANLADRLLDQPRCLQSLRRAFHLSLEYGFDFGPLLFTCGDVMPRLCSTALTHDIGSAQAKGIIRRHALPPPIQADERWPWPVKIYTLGRFAIEYDDNRSLSSRKESRKALDLLKLLISLGAGGQVSTDRLTALLWPDADVVAGRNSFENTLFRLRKILGDQQLQLRSGTLSLNPACCWNDLQALESCLCSPLPVDADNVASLAEQTIRLHTGTFLPGEERHAAIILLRERLQSRFIRRMGVLGTTLEAQGNHALSAQLYRRILEQNPLAESISRNLIHCLIFLGDRSEAFEVYRRCRQQLSIVLGIRPSLATEALVRTIRKTD